jgi:hypothetical protein
MAKPRRQKLKVFRTPIGFHDAYVAAPSRKAALAAWGSGTDLFSAGIAEEAADDAPGTKAALAEPGEVVRVARTAGTDGASPQPAPASGRGRKQAIAKPRPKPSRAQLDKAEASLAQLEERQAAERAELAKEEERLAKRRRALDDKHRKARAAAEAKRDAAKERYRAAMADWVG